MMDTKKHSEKKPPSRYVTLKRIAKKSHITENDEQQAKKLLVHHDKSNRTLLFTAAWKGDVKLIVQLIVKLFPDKKKRENYFNKTDKAGCNALYYCAKYSTNLFDDFRCLVNNGTDLGQMSTNKNFVWDYFAQNQYFFALQKNIEEHYKECKIAYEAFMRKICGVLYQQTHVNINIIWLGINNRIFDAAIKHNNELLYTLCSEIMCSKSKYSEFNFYARTFNSASYFQANTIFNKNKKCLESLLNEVDGEFVLQDLMQYRSHILTLIIKIKDLNLDLRNILKSEMSVPDKPSYLVNYLRSLYPEEHNLFLSVKNTGVIFSMKDRYIVVCPQRNKTIDAIEIELSRCHAFKAVGTIISDETPTLRSITLYLQRMYRMYYQIARRSKCKQSPQPTRKELSSMVPKCVSAACLQDRAKGRELFKELKQFLDYLKTCKHNTEQATNRNITFLLSLFLQMNQKLQNDFDVMLCGQTYDLFEIAKKEGYCIAYKCFLLKALLCDASPDILDWLHDIMSNEDPNFKFNELADPESMMFIMSECNLETFKWMLQYTELYFPTYWYKCRRSALQFIEEEKKEFSRISIDEFCIEQKINILLVINQLFDSKEFRSLMRHKKITIVPDKRKHYYKIKIDENNTIKIPICIHGPTTTEKIKCQCQCESLFEKAVRKGWSDIVNFHLLTIQHIPALIHLSLTKPRVRDTTVIPIDHLSLMKKSCTLKKSLKKAKKLVKCNIAKDLDYLIGVAISNMQYEIAFNMLKATTEEPVNPEYILYKALIDRKPEKIKHIISDDLYNKIYLSPIFRMILKEIEKEDNTSILSILKSYKNKRMKLEEELYATFKLLNPQRPLLKPPPVEEVSEKKEETEETKDIDPFSMAQEISQEALNVIIQCTKKLKKLAKAYIQLRSVGRKTNKKESIDIIKKNGFTIEKVRQFLLSIPENTKLNYEMFKRYTLVEYFHIAQTKQVNWLLEELLRQPDATKKLIFHIKNILAENSKLADKIFRTNRIKKKKKSRRKKKNEKRENTVKTKQQPHDLEPILTEADILKEIEDKQISSIDDPVDRFQNTRLHIATLCNDAKQTQELLKNRAKYKNNLFGEKAFRSSFRCPPNETTMLHINHIITLVKINECDEINSNDIFLIINYLTHYNLAEQLRKIFKHLPEHYQAFLYYTTFDGFTLLEKAVIQKKLLLLKLISRFHPNISLPKRPYGTACNLLFAEPYDNEQEKIFSCLLRKPLQYMLFSRDKYNANIFHYIFHYENFELLRLFIEKLPETDLKRYMNWHDKNFVTPIMILLNSNYQNTDPENIFQEILPYINICASKKCEIVVFHYLYINKGSVIANAIVDHIKSIAKNLTKDELSNMLLLAGYIFRLILAGFDVDKILYVLEDVPLQIKRTIINSSLSNHCKSLLEFVLTSCRWNFLNIFLDYIDSEKPYKDGNNILHLLAFHNHQSYLKVRNHYSKLQTKNNDGKTPEEIYCSTLRTRRS